MSVAINTGRADFQPERSGGSIEAGVPAQPTVTVIFFAASAPLRTVVAIVARSPPASGRAQPAAQGSGTTAPPGCVSLAVAPSIVLSTHTLVADASWTETLDPIPGSYWRKASVVAPR
jgi:hypothetical protein